MVLLAVIIAYFVSAEVTASVEGIWTPSPAPSPAVYPPPGPAQGGIKGAYWPSFNSFPVTAIDTSYFTHIYYAFVLPDPDTFEIVINPSDEQMLPEFTCFLHSQNHPAKAILSIGGGGDNTTVFSQMVSHPGTRSAFVESTITAARKYNLDGLDLDWEFPTNQEDMNNLGVLLSEWRDAIGKEALATRRTPLLLTAAVYYASTFSLWGEQWTYPGDSIREHVDWINVMSFGYSGAGWQPNNTGAPAALYDPNSEVSTSSGLQSWVRVGIPPQKVVMGIPLYGCSWQLADPKDHGIGAPAVGEGPDNGVMLFTVLVDFNEKNNATVIFDASTVSTYSYVGTSWIGYDDGRSVAAKIEYAKSSDHGGYFFWALGYDKDWNISKQGMIIIELIL
ncbi:class V chitinase CHIT5-like [Aristolochia californica]|uniref:class V chitinase CHIT5-like n=1 Tax=Aristolochia californica TaxID=171875 RepID=UPI0035DD6D3E